MTQVRINTVISAEKTAGSWREKDWEAAEDAFESHMVLLMSPAEQRVDHLLVHCCWMTTAFKLTSSLDVFSVENLTKNSKSLKVKSLF